jgi:peptidoglycan/xylan/chitin deacetylase (PgdA/CDA1 family)
MPTAPAYITTSWDDGHPLDHRLADLLRANGLTGTFYVPPKSQNQTMPPAAVRQLADAGFEVGAHTLNHVFLDGADDAAAEREIVGSREWVQQTTGQPCPMFCPPGGKYAPRDLRLIRAAGFAGIRTVELLSTDVPRRQGGLSVLPTTVQAHPHGRGAYLRNAAKRRSVVNVLAYVRAGLTTDWVTLLDRQLASVARHGGVFHLWGHTWEIEQHGQWPAVERALKIMARHLPAIPCLTNGALPDRPAA